MTDQLVLVLALGLSLMALLTLARHRAVEHWRSTLVSLELRFPRDLDPDRVVTFLAGLSGLATQPWRRFTNVHAMVFEVSGTETGIQHRLLVPRPLARAVTSQLRAAMPSVAVVETPATPIRPLRRAVALRLANANRRLRVDQPATVSAAILATLHPLRHDEELVVQWVATPIGPGGPVVMPSRPAQPRAGIGRFISHFPTQLRPEADDAAARRAKYATPLFSVVGRIGAQTISESRARALLRQVLSSLGTTHAPGAQLRPQARPSQLVVRDIARRSVPVVRVPAVLNAEELAALVAFPVKGVEVAGLRLGGCRQLPPSSDIPAVGRVVARGTFPGAERPLALAPLDALRHLQVIGPTGVGKSTLLLNLITQDMAAGRGVIVIEPKGDLVAEILHRVPQHRVGDVAVLDPTDDARPVGLNLLAGSADSRELLVEQVVGIFHQLYRHFWGPRTDDVLRAALLTLTHEPGMTLCEVPLLLTDASFRRRVVGRTDDPVALGPFWASYEAMSGAERAQAIGPVMNKLRAFLLRRRVRNVIGQANPTLDLDRVLRTRQILLVPLSKGLLGDEAAALLGSLVVARLWQAVQRRAAIAPERRFPVFAFVDEFQDYLHLPTSVGDVLAQARGLGLGLTLAHQHLGQLPPDLRQAVLANARSRVIFQCAATDARALTQELAGHLKAEDLQGLGQHEVVLSLSTGDRVAPPATGVTLPAPAVTGNATAASEHSRRTYGVDRDKVETAIRARHQGRAVTAPLGRSRRLP